MELGPSWEAANCVATQELPRILWTPNIRYLTATVVFIRGHLSFFVYIFRLPSEQPKEEGAVLSRVLGNHVRVSQRREEALFG
jgi:hypothetical protein